MFTCAFIVKIDSSKYEVKVIIYFCCRYIYTNNTEVDGDTVLKCLNAAKKYCVGGLVELCSQFLEKSFSVENVCTLFEQAKFFQLQELINKCKAFIEVNELEVVRGRDIQNLNVDSLADFLANGKLLANEIDYFEAANRWSENECRRQEIEVSPENKRNVLGPAFREIKFGLLAPEELARTVQPTGLLSGDELANINRWIAQKELPSDESLLQAFPSIPRSQVLCKTDINTTHFEKTQTCADRFYTTLSVSHPLKLTKIKTKISDYKSKVISVSLGKDVNKTEDETVQSEDITPHVHHDGKTFVFGKPVELKPGTKYTITVNLERENYMTYGDYTDPYFLDFESGDYEHFIPLPGAAASTFMFGGVCVTVCEICDKIKSIEFEIASKTAPIK